MKERLKELRHYLQLSQLEFGKKILVTQNHISSLESGRKTLTDRTIKEICVAFGVNEAWLKDGNGEMMVDLIAQLDDVDDETKDMLRKYQMLNPEDKHKMGKILDTFLSE